MTRPEFTTEQQLAICQQVAKLVRAKLPIAGKLAEVGQGASRAVVDSSRTVDERIAQGKTLAEAIASDDSRNSRSLAGCITAGEACGSLDKTLEAWAAMHIANSRATRALRIALFYPSMLILVTFVSLGTVTWKLVPQYALAYAMFDQQLPIWLETIVWLRESFWPFFFFLGLLSVTPLVVWAYRRRKYDRTGLSLDPVKRLRSQALSARIAGWMLEKNLPLIHIVNLACQSSGACDADAKLAFQQLQQQQAIPSLAKETSMLLASIHAGILDPTEAADNLNMVATHLQQTADITATRQERWVPMLVALTVGTITILTYALLIYLPWVWLMQQQVAPRVYDSL